MRGGGIRVCCGWDMGRHPGQQQEGLQSGHRGRKVWFVLFPPWNAK